jgi:hypothetical protein
MVYSFHWTAFRLLKVDLDSLLKINQYVNVVACYFPRHYLKIMLHTNLAYEVAHTYSHRPNQYALAILGDPNQVNFKIVLSVRSLTALPSHAPMLHEFALYLKTKDFHHPRRRY